MIQLNCEKIAPSFYKCFEVEIQSPFVSLLAIDVGRSFKRHSVYRDYLRTADTKDFFYFSFNKLDYIYCLPIFEKSTFKIWRKNIVKRQSYQIQVDSLTMFAFDASFQKRSEYFVYDQPELRERKVLRSSTYISIN